MKATMAWRCCACDDLVKDYLCIPYKRDPDIIPLWVKIYNVPLEAWTVKGISALATRVGKPLVMDNVTASMCIMGIGRVGFARVLVEVKANKSLPDEIEIVYKNRSKEEICRKTVKVLYDWKPSCCTKCCVFGHATVQCGRNKDGVRTQEKRQNGNKEKRKEGNSSKSNNDGKVDSEGFITVQKRKNGNDAEKVLNPNYKPHNQHQRFVNQKNNMNGKAKVQYEFQPKKKVDNGTKEHVMPVETTMNNTSGTIKRSANKFSVFDTYDENDLNEIQNIKSKEKVEKLFDQKRALYGNVDCGNNSDSEEVEDVYIDDTGMVECMEKDGMDSAKQSMFGEITTLNYNKSVSCMFVYVANGGIERRWLWKDLQMQKRIVRDRPWIMMGDMNVTMVSNEHSAGGSSMTSDINDFKECVNSIEMEDIASSGLFANFVADKQEFLYIVSKYWTNEYGGCKMFQIVKRIRSLKRGLKKLIWKNGNIFDNITSLKNKLKEIQIEIDKDPRDKQLRSEESSCLQEYVEALKDEEKLLFQKAKIKWLSVGDRNNAYFHKVLKRNVVPINDFEASCQLIKKKLSVDAANFMVKDVGDDEIKEALFQIDNNKAPGPDGFSLLFFKKAWIIIGKVVCKSVREFFSTRKMLKVINSTLISLIPKLQTPDKVTDFRHIACCNVIYKCISKVITNRIKASLGHLVGPNQSAFVPNRHIQDNILLSQELLMGYERKEGPKRVAMKIDIQKAYDTVNWKFLEAILKVFGFHEKMVQWIVSYVTTTSFYINVNEESFGYFKGGRGLRQGDPVSPYLFTLVMEILSLIVQDKKPTGRILKTVGLRWVPTGKIFTSSTTTVDSELPRGSNTDITNLYECIQTLDSSAGTSINVQEEQNLNLSAGTLSNLKKERIKACIKENVISGRPRDKGFVGVLKDVIEEFGSVFGLLPNYNKSTIIFGSMKEEDKQEILDCVPFKVEKLPVRYLGVPLTSKRIGVNNCKSILDKIRSRVLNWKNKCLSYAGRLQLIAFFFQSIHVYWASVFLLPKTVINDINSMLKGFLWNQGELAQGKANVSWKNVCKPKIQVNEEVYDSWGGNNILRIKEEVKKFLVMKVGNEEKTSVIYDNWYNVGILQSFLTNRDIYNARVSPEIVVKDLIDNESCNWPEEWIEKWPILSQYQKINLDESKNDVLVWRNKKGNEGKFTVKQAYEDLRSNSDEVKWCKTVWFLQNISKHSFILWMVIQNKLITQDKLRSWGSYDLMVCALCNQDNDSHQHLFFKCTYAEEFWGMAKQKMGVMYPELEWNELVDMIACLYIGNFIESIIRRLGLAASAPIKGCLAILTKDRIAVHSKIVLCNLEYDWCDWLSLRNGWTGWAMFEGWNCHGPF
ncbi:RNA-directed DNA polymerase, eukaryota, reverse transcriptase zinc-binding domain protein [Tanacetum coccineum]|uniref:RNA-directed DNA polymerase, eukaryota, reverse transcriptase zinc-binding domain protein n=1 Tax=Tanacetum coccineum TaxID=301880 RepID=A0ABQ5D9U4_9ASTR